MKTRTLCAVSLALLSAGAVARPASAAVRCATTKTRWNAPAGAAVVTRHPGVVSAIFDQADRYWTHIMLSHGPEEASHAHRPDPLMNPNKWAVLTDLVLEPNNLRAGEPGASRVNTAALFAAQYGYQSALVFPAKKKGGPEVEALVGGLNKVEVFDSDGATTNLFRLLVPRFEPSVGAEIEDVVPYSFFQFKNIGTNHRGELSPDGFACSTFLAWASKRAAGAEIPVEAFDKETVLRGLRAAYSATERVCNDDVLPGLPAVERDFANLTDACGRAGAQVANCLSGVGDGHCDKRGDEWADPANWLEGDKAISIGPDRVVNWQLSDEENPSPWNQRTADDPPFLLQWSDDGEELFGCWAADDDLPDGKDPLPKLEDEDRVGDPGKCPSVDLEPDLGRIFAYHIAGAGDEEMDGNHPSIEAKIELDVSANTTVFLRTTLKMKEGGGDGSAFENAPEGMRVPIYSAPAGCQIKGVDTFDDLVDGHLFVADAGVNNHAETHYDASTGAEVSGLVESARCRSDTDGGIFGGSDSAKIYCDFNLHHLTVSLTPR